MAVLVGSTANAVVVASSKPELLAVRKEFPANTLKEFVAYAKANESKLNMGHAGVGSVSYVGCLLLNNAIGIRPTMVPFTGTAPVMNAILAGQVDYDCDPVLGPLPHVRAGTVKAYAVTTPARLGVAPDIPTVDEAGLPGLHMAVWQGIWAPKGTPQPAIDRLDAAVVDALADPRARQRLIELGQDIFPRDQQTPAALRALQQRRKEDALKLKALRAQIKAGVVAFERGEFVEVADADLDGYLDGLTPDDRPR